MEIITPLNNKVSMFATNQELYAQLTDKEIIDIKLCKLDEYAQDLLHLTEKTNGELSMASSSKYNNIQEILLELNKLNK
ncbi:MAG: hypothetical protein HOC66_05690 [Flavobacteriales bacterium]|nr:hypothetical protein [Flavobacteriales bacterium]